MPNAVPQPEPPASPTVEKILLAAEEVFAERGFDGTGMKAIAQHADVSQALLHYHFGTKDRLYADVIERRSRLINTERLALLDRVDITTPDALDQILRAMFLPPFGPSGGERAYARIFGRLVVGDEREQVLVRKHYDPTAQRFISALETVLPGADRAVATMCYTLSLGALVAVISRDGRAERLMGKGDLQSVDAVLDQLVAYAKGGALALQQTLKSDIST